MKITVFWNAKPRSLAYCQQLFERTFCLHLQDRVPEEINLHTHRRDNLKSHLGELVYEWYCHVLGVCVTYKTGFAFDDRIY
jgi:hypothetical protein